MPEGSTQSSTQPVMVVLTGGSHSGKTTCINALAARGYQTIPEAGLMAINELNEKLGVRNQTLWRRDHFAEFQALVTRKQVLNESGHRSDPKHPCVFCDRGIADGLAYCQLHDQLPSSELLHYVRTHPYHAAFVLDTLPIFDQRSDTGRSSTPKDSIELNHYLKQAYQAIGCTVYAVPVASVEDRLTFITGHAARHGIGVSVHPASNSEAG